METFRLLSTSADLGIAQVGPVCLAVWHGPVTQPLFERQKTALHNITAQHSGSAGFLCVISPTTPPPEAKLRQASLDMVTSLGDQLAWVVCVIEGDGFRAATTRSVLAGMSLLLRRRKPTVTFTADVSSAVTLVGSRFDAEHLRQAHARVLAEMQGEAPQHGKT